jgi:hypothetical protein
MKIFRTFIGASLFFPIALMSCANPNIDAVGKNNGLSCLAKHGKNGHDGRNGENGQDGENGQNGGNGGNGGNSDWGRGGDGGNGGNAPTNSAQVNGQTEEWEYKILKDICQQIIETTISQVYGASAISDNNALETACKQNLSNYLLQIGTPAAQKLWQEYEAINWSYPAITNI